MKLEAKNSITLFGFTYIYIFENNSLHSTFPAHTMYRAVTFYARNPLLKTFHKPRQSFLMGINVLQNWGGDLYYFKLCALSETTN
jgi:hypothetical protein